MAEASEWKRLDSAPVKHPEKWYRPTTAPSCSENQELHFNRVTHTNPIAGHLSAETHGSWGSICPDARAFGSVQKPVAGGSKPQPMATHLFNAEQDPAEAKRRVPAWSALSAAAAPCTLPWREESGGEVTIHWK